MPLGSRKIINRKMIIENSSFRATKELFKSNSPNAKNAQRLRVGKSAVKRASKIKLNTPIKKIIKMRNEEAKAQQKRRKSKK